MAKDDRDLGINLDDDPEDEITVYDDRLAAILVAAGIVYVGIRIFGHKRYRRR